MIFQLQDTYKYSLVFTFDSILKKYFSFSDKVLVSFLCTMFGGSFTPNKEDFFSLIIEFDLQFVLFPFIRGLFSFTLWAICRFKET